MKKIFYLLVIPGILIISCEKESNIDEKDDGPSTGETIASKTIDEGGGTISSGNFEVTIPAEIFSVPTSVSISKITNNDFEGDQLSDLYFVNNIPSEYNDSIKVSLSGIVAVEDMKVYIAENVFIKSSNAEETIYRPTEYKVNGDKIEVVLPPATWWMKSLKQEDAEGSGSFSAGLLAVAGQRTMLSGEGHFKITYPAIEDENAEKLGDFLEEAYDKFQSGDFGFSYNYRSSWPVSVTIKPLGDAEFGFMSASIWGDNYASMSFNSKKISDHANMRITAGHEFMHFVQNLYDPRNRFSKAKFAAPHLWIDEAVAVWAEEFFTEESNYCSSIRSGHEMAPFKGMLKGAEEDAGYHGYGMSSLIKYIEKNFGKASIKTTYEKIRDDYNPDYALGESTNLYYNEWYYAFLHQYTSGLLYTDSDVARFIGNKSGSFDIKSSSDTLKEFSENFPELSGKFYTINISSEAVKEESALEIKITGDMYAKACVYKFNSSTIEPIGYAASTVDVAEIKKMAEEGYKILVLVANPYNSYDYDDEKQIDFTIKVVRNKTLFKRMDFDFDVMANNMTTWQTGDPTYSSNHYYFDMRNVPVTQSGNTIFASWDGINGANRSGNAVIQVQGNTIVSFEFNETYVQDDIVTLTHVSGTNISLTEDNSWGKTFKSESTCSILTEFYEKTTYTTFETETIDFYCDASYGNDAYIAFYYDE